ncbi:MAG TPA: sigma-70 family RNA polymerase sigma factor [Hyalangium sp.]|nr:sigma-70 family RNA polymerase sigma factor [Hyalangium sp.]
MVRSPGAIRLAMAQASELVAAFLEQTKGRFAPPTDVAVLGRLLERSLESARAQWPGVELSGTEFVRHLAERLSEAPPESSLEPLFEQLSVAELYLACACLRGIPEAIAAFEQHYLTRLPDLLGHLRLPAAAIDDVCQLARVKILVHKPDGAPRINEYTGRGALMSWVRVIAVRIALKRSAADKPASDESVTEVLESLPAAEAGAELDLIKQRHRTEFRQALREAFAALSTDDRHLLRLYFADRLSTTELGELFRVNQSTISRWLKSARQTVYEETRRRLQERLRLSAREFQSFLAVLDSQLDLSMSQIFGEEDALSR